MKKSHLFCEIALFLFLFSEPATFAKAEPNLKSREALQHGMSKSEVQARWGEPLDVTDNDLKALTTWRYGAAKNSPAVSLQFINGSLQPEPLVPIRSSNTDEKSYFLKRDEFGKQRASPIHAREKRIAQARQHSFMAVTDPKVLTDILKDVPNEPEKDDKNPATPATNQVIIE